jgi:hypothetical protein
MVVGVKYCDIYIYAYAGRVAQVVEYLANRHKALSSNSSTKKKVDLIHLCLQFILIRLTTPSLSLISPPSILERLQ